MIAMQVEELQKARGALASGGHAYSSSYTHCEVSGTFCPLFLCRGGSTPGARHHAVRLVPGGWASAALLRPRLVLVAVAKPCDVTLPTWCREVEQLMHSVLLSDPPVHDPGRVREHHPVPGPQSVAAQLLPVRHGQAGHGCVPLFRLPLCCVSVHRCSSSCCTLRLSGASQCLPLLPSAAGARDLPQSGVLCPAQACT